MKLTSKEIAILSVFLSIVIIVAGLFLFILPEYEKIEPNRSTLNNAKAEREQLYQTLTRETTIDQEIQDAIDQANTLSLNFYDDMTTYEADVIVREILEATNMSTNSLSLSSFTTSILTVTDYVETAVSYPLKEYAGYASIAADTGEGITNIQYDEEGNIVIPDEYTEEDLENALKNYLTALLSTQSQTIGSITVSFTVEGTRGDFLNFLNYVANLERATYISSTNIAYTGSAPTSGSSVGNTPIGGNGIGTSVLGGNGEESADEGAESEETTAVDNTPAQLTSDSEISAPITMTLYCITPMQSMETSADQTAEPETDTDTETETETETEAEEAA